MEVRRSRKRYLHTQAPDGAAVYTIDWTAFMIEDVLPLHGAAQQHRTQLAHISEDQIDLPGPRRRSWDAVLERLDALDNLSLDDRRRIEATVALKVPRPT